VLTIKEVVQRLLEESGTKKVVSALAILYEQTNRIPVKCKILIKKWIMNSVSHNHNKSNNNTSQDHLVHINPWTNTNKMQILNINPNNSANLLIAKTWFSKFLPKYTRTNLSTNKLFKKIKSMKRKKKMKTQTKNKTKCNTVGRMIMISKRSNRNMKNKMRKLNTTKKVSTLRRTKMNMIRISNCIMNKWLVRMRMEMEMGMEMVMEMEMGMKNKN
jgi:hypothetical protein